MVFNIAQLTSGTALRDWNPANDQLQENAMATRAGLRSALHDGPLTYNQLKERFGGTNILTSLSQMVANGQLIRSGSGGETLYTIAQLPQQGRPPTTANARALKLNGSDANGDVQASVAHLPRRGRPPKAAGARVSKKDGRLRKSKRPRNSAVRKTRASGGHIEKTIADLLRRREAIDRAIAALEELAHSLR